MSKVLCANIRAFIELDDIDEEDGKEIVKTFVEDIIYDNAILQSPIQIGEDVEYRVIDYN